MLNKKISTIKGVIIIILFLVITGGAFILFKGIDCNLFFSGKELLTEDFDEAEQVDKIPELEVFFEDFKNEIRPYCFEVEIKEKEYQGKYEGFSWIDENKEAKLIKETYHLELNREEIEKNKNCIENITSYLKENFVLNQKNTENDMRSFEKENIKCTFFEIKNHYFNFECGDISKSVTPSEYKEIYGQMNSHYSPLIKITIHDLVEGFAIIGVEDVYGVGTKALIKKENGQWKTLQAAQENFLCEIVFEEKVPFSLVDTCVSYKSGEFMKYNQVKEEWEIF